MDRDLIKMLVEAIRKSDARKTSAYDTTAVVKRVEDGVAWVHIPGGVDETPVRLTVDAKAGDTVQVRVSGGRAFITGNATAPPTDNTLARTVQGGLNVTRRALASVKKTAEGAMRIAGNTHQYFWFTETGTDTGAHITEKPQEQFLADPQNGGGNLLARSNGIAVRDGLTELATFGADGTRVGADGAGYIETGSDGIAFGDADGEHLRMGMRSYESGSFDNAYVMQSDVPVFISHIEEYDGTDATAVSQIQSQVNDTQEERLALANAFALSTATSGTRNATVSMSATCADNNNGVKYASVSVQSTPGAGKVTMYADDGIDLLSPLSFNGSALFARQTFSATGLSANTYYLTRTFNITKAGYTPIAVNTRVNQAAIYTSSVDFSTPGSTSVTVADRNATSISNLNLYLDVTYARSELL